MLHLDILNTFFLCLLEQQTKSSEQNSIKHILWDGCLKGLQQSYRLGVNLKNVGSFCKKGRGGVLLPFWNIWELFWRICFGLF